MNKRKKEPIISVFNLKNGVGCSSITWSIAHTLHLNIFQHDKALHHIFLEKRKEAVKNKKLFTNHIEVKPINKRKFESGVYDLGSDINYGYVKQLLKKSEIIIIPTDLSFEVLVKTIASIRYVINQNEHANIFILFNRLSNYDPDREKKYTKAGKDLIVEEIDRIGDFDDFNIEFLYMRYSFAIYREQSEGKYYLDHFIRQDKKFPKITAFRLLQHLRFYTLVSGVDSAFSPSSKQKEKAIKEIEDSSFFENHKPLYNEYVKNIDIKKDLFNTDFNDKHNKCIKDMLILISKIKKIYGYI